MENKEKNKLIHSQSDTKRSEDTESGSSSKLSRSEMDATHGDDAIEIEMNEAERLSAMATFAPMDGDLGDESEDFEDLPIEERKNRNFYDPALSTGGKSGDSNKERPEGIHVSRAFQAGVSFKDKDSYVDDKPGESNKKEKSNRADQWESENDQNEDEEA